MKNKPTSMKRKNKSKRAHKSTQNSNYPASDPRSLYLGYSEYGWLLAKDQFERSYEYEHQRQVKEFCQTLLAMGGNLVCINFDDAAWRIPEIAQQSKLLTHPRIILKRGEPNRCELNCIRLLEQEGNKYTLYKGFGLSKKQLWYSHFWLVDEHGNIIETTNPAIKYFGYPVLSKKAIEVKG